MRREFFIMEQAKPANKKALWYVVVGVVLVALIVIFAVVYGNSNQPVAGSKTITVQIVSGDSTETKTIQTDAEYLRGALATGLNLGRGSGPLDHTFDLVSRFAQSSESV